MSNTETNEADNAANSSENNTPNDTTNPTLATSPPHDKDCPFVCCTLDPEARKQLQVMLDFIKQEALEKIDEIDTRTEEDFQRLKAAIIEEDYAKIYEEYDALESKYNSKMQRDAAKRENNGRLIVLSERAQYIDDMVEETRCSLDRHANPGSPEYKQTMKLLILEGACLMLEPVIHLTIRRKDVDMVQDILRDCEDEYKKMTEGGEEISILIDPNRYLHSDSRGGVVLRDGRHHIKIDNTLNARLIVTVSKILPQIRKCLFNDVLHEIE